MSRLQVLFSLQLVSHEMIKEVEISVQALKVLEILLSRIMRKYSTDGRDQH